MRRAVFLDRDGVLNRALVREGKPYPPMSVSELELLPGVCEACQVLKLAGFVLIVITNQPDVARGTQRREIVEAINAALQAQVPVDAVRVCYHDQADNCTCRKPQPGLLIQAADRWQLDLSHSWMVGDRWKDIEAGRRAGCKTAFIDYGYAECQPKRPDCRVRSLTQAARLITSHGETAA